MDLGIEGVDDAANVLRVLVIGIVLHIEHQQLALVVLLDPTFVALVEALEVLDADGVLILTASLTDLAYQLAGVAASPMPPIPLPLGGSVILPIPQSVLGAIVGFGSTDFERASRATQLNPMPQVGALWRPSDVAAAHEQAAG